ncbi:MAG: DNA mismatch repair protein MutS, partial [Bacteroidales bacterium]|nr:DNA mismatch repair protein MutS [Bacteroidales bacterium]
MFADRTTSNVGQQFLYNQLKRPHFSQPDFNNQESLIKELQADPNKRKDIEFALNKLTAYESYYMADLFQKEQLTPPKWYVIIPALSFLSFLTLSLAIINLKWLMVWGIVALANFGVHYWNKSNLYQYIGVLPQLLKLNAAAKTILKSQPSNPNPIPIKEAIGFLDGIRYRMAIFRLEAKFESDLMVFLWSILEYIKIVFLIEPLLLFGVLKKIRAHKDQIRIIFLFVGSTDAALSVLRLRNSLKAFCLPQITKKETAIMGEDFYHPLVVNCQPNSINITNKSVLITGSNMSGKTTFIRSIGINIIAALSMNTCFAKSFSMPGTSVSSAIRINDNLINDKSYYLDEVITIGEMIKQAHSAQFNLFLLDELFKGTNTIERVAAGKAVLSELNKGNSLVIVSTHDVELAAMLADEYDLYYFSEHIDNSQISFDYELKPGFIKNGNAIALLKLYGYPDSIVAEAEKLSAQLAK